LINEDKAVVGYLLHKNNLQVPVVAKGVRAIIESYPRVVGASTTPYASQDFQKFLTRTLTIQAELKDQYVSLEVLFLAI
jgi:ATP-dependent Clp protease ATP-binding subunit ClpA